MSAALSLIEATFAWPFKSAPAPPPPPPSMVEAAAPAFLAILVCWALPALFYVLSRTDGAKPISPMQKSAVTGKGIVVPKDTERRKAAQQEKPAQAVGMQRLAMAAAFIVPHLIVWLLQTGPTMSEQLSDWASVSYAQLTDGKLTLPFQCAVAALSIERLCYTWVHSFSTSFVSFANTPLGRMMGKKPLDVVLSIFYINKVIQLGTFFLFYFYTIDFASPFDSGFSFLSCSPLQWIWLFYGIAIGQGLNHAIYQAIGKAGVYYGYRLGEPVPWVTGFPFSVVPHPQYFGVCCCVIGVNVFTATKAHIAAGWFNLTAVQVLFYVYMALVEDYL